MSKKIHLVSANSKNVKGLEYSVSEAFKDIGYNVVETDYRVMNRKTVEERIRLINDVNFLLVIKGERVSPEAVYSVRCPTVLWMQDSIIMNKDALNVIQHRSWAYNTVYTFDCEEINLYENLGTKACWMPLAVDTDIFKPVDNIEQNIDIGFTGSLTGTREQLIYILLENGYSVQYNYTYDNYIKNICSTKININIGVGLSGYQMRVFETLACGGFLLTNDIPSKGKLFKDTKHLVYFTQNSLNEQIKFYLDNPNKRKQIGLQGREEILGHHTYKHRILNIIEDIKNAT